MITLSNGHSFEYATASGAMGYNGMGWPHEQPLRLLGLIDENLFTHRMKTITLPPRKGNFRWWKPWDCVRPIFNGTEIVGTINAYGLSNKGLDWFLNWIDPFIEDSDIHLIASIFSDAKDSAKELGILAAKLGKLPFVAIEYNTSCPNAGHGVEENVETIRKGVTAIEKNCGLPIGLKVSVAQDVEAILREVSGKIQYLDINSVPWKIAFPDRESPLAKFGGGGVSGKAAQPFTWPLTKRLAELTSVPVIGLSAWYYEDLKKIRALKAKAISFGSLCLCYPWCPTSFVKKEISERTCNDFCI